MALLKTLYDMLFKLVLQVIEMDVVPDFLLRMGIRWLLGKRYKDLVRAKWESSGLDDLITAADVRRRDTPAAAAGLCGRAQGHARCHSNTICQ